MPVLPEEGIPEAGPEEAQTQAAFDDAGVSRLVSATAELNTRLSQVNDELRQADADTESALFSHDIGRKKVLAEAIERAKRLATEQAQLQERIARAVLAQLQLSIPGNLAADISPGIKGDARQSVEQAIADVRSLVAPGVVDAVIAKINPAGRGFQTARAAFNPSDETIGIDQRTGSSRRVLWHELGHAIENASPEIHDALVAFYQSRTQGELLEWLGDGYSRAEQYRRDRFLHPYMGKEYLDVDGNPYATEILSMGIETLMTRPAEFAATDAEYLKFTINLLRGLE